MKIDLAAVERLQIPVLHLGKQLDDCGLHLKIMLYGLASHTPHIILQAAHLMKRVMDRAVHIPVDSIWLRLLGLAGSLDILKDPVEAGAVFTKFLIWYA
jgi:hypothetical protein